MVDFNLVDANGSVSVHAFANKSVATRYANKHGLSVAKSIGALVVVDDAQNAIVSVADSDSDVDALDITAALDMLSGDVDSDAQSDAPRSLRDTALAFDNATVADMCVRLRESFYRRDDFEASNGLSLVDDNSYTREAKRMIANEIAVSRFFLALDIEPSDVIERKVSSNAMFNAKALKKVTELAQYVTGFGSKLERVTRAFIACALIATDRGVEVITNETNRKFLCSAGFSGQISDQDLIDHLDELRHRSMSSGAETQSSQARNVLDVLGLGTIKSVTKARDAITLHTANAFYAQFRADFLR